MNDPNWHRLDKVPDEADRCICGHWAIDHDPGCLEDGCDCEQFEYWEPDPGDPPEPRNLDEYGRQR